jgi:L-amino acid N-acyltransferase YncA
MGPHDWISAVLTKGEALSYLPPEALRAEDITLADAIALGNLIHLLAPRRPLLWPKHIRELVADPHNHVWVIREAETRSIVATATLTEVHTFSAYIGIINDVVRSQYHTEGGLGRALTEALITQAEELQVSRIILSSDPKNPKRSGARALYEELGFVPSTDGRWMIRERT